LGGSGGAPLPVRTTNRTLFLSSIRSIRSPNPLTANPFPESVDSGSTQAFLPALVESQNLLASGIVAPQAGLGHFTVRAHSQAMTVASPPPYSFGSRTFGYR